MVVADIVAVLEVVCCIQLVDLDIVFGFDSAVDTRQVECWKLDIGQQIVEEMETVDAEALVAEPESTGELDERTELAVDTVVEVPTLVVGHTIFLDVVAVDTVERAHILAAECSFVAVDFRKRFRSVFGSSHGGVGRLWAASVPQFEVFAPLPLSSCRGPITAVVSGTTERGIIRYSLSSKVVGVRPRFLGGHLRYF